MLTNDQKKQLIDRRLQEYAVKMFNLELDAAALNAAGDAAGVESARQRIAALKQASAAVEAMKHADS